MLAFTTIFISILIIKIEAIFTNGSTHDYIIVGGGSSGATLAGRLSEETNATVLLIEAGEIPPDTIKFKSPFLSLQFWSGDQDATWNYTSVVQKYAFLGQKEKKYLAIGGKVLGGSSTVNTMIYSRGNKHDYDLWASVGAEGWSYKDVLPYFKKSEAITLTKDIESDYHGVFGPLSVSVAAPVNYSPLRQVFLDVGKAMGYKFIDYHGQQQCGVGQVQTTTLNGARCSTERAFLRPANGRKNLKILTKAHVTKIVFDKKRATGVQFNLDGQILLAKANKEIIISAGAYQTPQILMLSGIGPRKELEKLGIKVIHDLPGVGQNLHDHVSTIGLTFTTNSTDTIKEADVVANFEENSKLFEKGLGIFTQSGEVVMFSKSKYEDGPDDYPDTELMWTPLPSILEGNSFNDKITEYMKPFLDQGLISTFHSTLHPKSKGQIRLKSNNPFDQPILDYQYLSDERDVKVTVEGLKLMLEMAKTEPLRKINTQPLNVPLPGCEQHVLYSDDYLTCFTRMTTVCNNHPVGTCKMGNITDPMTVVDSKLRVKGLTGLRIADCSIIPIITSGHTNAPAIMIGEKAADLIRLNQK